MFENNFSCADSSGVGSYDIKSDKNFTVFLDGINTHIVNNTLNTAEAVLLELKNHLNTEHALQKLDNKQKHALIYKLVFSLVRIADCRLGQALLKEVPSLFLFATPENAKGNLHTQYSLDILPHAHAISLLGFAHYIFSAMLGEVRHRQTFGKRLIENQHVEFTLAELHAQLLAFEANVELSVECAQYTPHKKNTLQAHRQRLERQGEDLAKTLADTYLQFSGGRGYMKGHPAEYCYRVAFHG